MFPLEVYLLVRNVDRLRPGIYHFDPNEHCLDLISRKNPFAELVRATYVGELAQAALALALTGVSSKSRAKYGERGYRFMLLEAGHAAQNFLLCATALGLSAFTIGGFIDDDLDRLLEIDGFEETSLYLMAAGRPRKTT